MEFDLNKHHNVHNATHRTQSVFVVYTQPRPDQNKRWLKTHKHWAKKNKAMIQLSCKLSETIIHVPSSQSVPLHVKPCSPSGAAVQSNRGVPEGISRSCRPDLLSESASGWLTCLAQSARLNGMGKHCKVKLLGGLGSTNSQEEEVLMHH